MIMNFQIRILFFGPFQMVRWQLDSYLCEWRYSIIHLFCTLFYFYFLCILATIFLESPIGKRDKWPLFLHPKKKIIIFTYIISIKYLFFWKFQLIWIKALKNFSWKSPHLTKSMPFKVLANLYNPQNYWQINLF